MHWGNPKSLCSGSNWTCLATEEAICYLCGFYNYEEQPPALCLSVLAVAGTEW